MARSHRDRREPGDRRGDRPPVRPGRRGGRRRGEDHRPGLAAELYEDNIAVNALSPSRVVPTPGTVFHHLTGRVAYSQQLIAELGGTIPARG